MTTIKRSLLALIASCTLSLSAVPQNQKPLGIRPDPPVGKGIVALKAARLIDGTGAPLITNAVVIVTDNKITAVGDVRSVSVPAEAKVINLGDVTLLPDSSMRTRIWLVKCLATPKAMRLSYVITNRLRRSSA